MSRNRPIAIWTLALVALSAPLLAQGFSTNEQGRGEQVLPLKHGSNLGGCGSVTLTHSASQVITALNSVSCNAGGLHAENSYYRVFDLAAFGQADFDVCSVEIGVEQAAGAGGSQPIEIRLYTTPTGTFPGGALTSIGTLVTAIADQSLTLADFPVAGYADAGLDLVVEVFTPDGQAAGNSFFIGSNASGQTGPSYIRAPTCGATVPTNLAGLGFPGMHIVMNVHGDPGTPALLPTESGIVDQPGFADSCTPFPANQNGVLEPGEQISLPVEISAIGGSFSGISATLVSNTPGVQVLLGSATYPNIAAGGSAGPNSPFQLYIAETVPCGTAVELALTIIANEGGPFASNLTGQIGADPASPTGLPLAIPDNAPAGATSTLNVSNSFVLTDVNVVYQMSHTWVGDVVITLTPPGGGPITLMDRPGVPASTFGCSGDNMDVIFDDSASFDPETNCPVTVPVFSGPVLPFSPLSVLNGTNVQGNWTLTVSDHAGGDTGTVTNWNLQTTPPILGSCNICLGNEPGGGPIIQEIPTLSKSSLALLGALLAGAAALLIRRRG